MRIIIVSGLVALASGCAASEGSSIEAGEQGSDELTASVGQAIVNGEHACDPALDAVGAVMFHFSDPEYGDFQEFYCSATLIAPKVALTARHCVVGSIYYEPDPAFSNYVAFGQDAFAPDREVKITSFLAAPPGPGGCSTTVGET